MPQSSLEILPATPHATLVTFSWGTHTLRYCRWTNDLAFQTEIEQEEGEPEITEVLYTHEPSLKVIWDKPQHGGAEDSPAIVQMASFVPPFDKLILPYAHAPVAVLIEEVSPGDAESKRALFLGRIRSLTSKPDARGAVGRATVVGHKAKLRKRCGRQALSTCDLIFGGEVCGFDLTANTIFGAEVTELNVGGFPNRLTLDLGTSPPDMQNDRWARGYIEDEDGLRITIRKSFDDSSNTFDLREVPPPEWDGSVVRVVPGCNKEIATCRLHDREESFSGLGIAAPFYNPTLAIS